MNFDIIKPYTHRLKRRKQSLKAYVYDSRETTKEKVMALAKGDELIFDAYAGDDENDLDLVVVGYNKINEKNLLDNAWNRLAYDGWLFINDTDVNRSEVEEFRKNNKITSLMTKIEGWIFFQREDYSKRNVPQTKLIDDTLNSDGRGWDEIPVPDWTLAHIKEEYLQKYGNGKIFIETGTYLGQAVEMARRSKLEFTKILSIEINHQLAEKAKKGFDFDDRIEIIEGDSVEKIAEICQTLDEPAVFWLDAHASGPLPGGKYGPSPLLQELEAIKNTGRKDHTIFIDDRRLMGTAEWGGISEESIMKAAHACYEGVDVMVKYLNGEVAEDVICFTVVENEYVEEKTDEKVLPDKVKDYFKLAKNDGQGLKTNKPKITFLEI